MFKLILMTRIQFARMKNSVIACITQLNFALALFHLVAHILRVNCTQYIQLSTQSCTLYSTPLQVQYSTCLKISMLLGRFGHFYLSVHGGTKNYIVSNYKPIKLCYILRSDLLTYALCAFYTVYTFVDINLFIFFHKR